MTDEQSSSDTLDEVKTISNMLKRAHKEGLATEVVWSFANDIKAGTKSYAEAAAYALNEWDV